VAYHVVAAVRLRGPVGDVEGTGRRAEHRSRETLETFAIITSEPSPTVAKIHDREPVMLLQDQFDAWLDAGVAVDDLRAMLRPAPDELVRIQKASTLVNSVRNDGPELLATA